MAGPTFNPSGLGPFRPVARALAFIGGLGVAFMVCLTVAGVFWRYVLNDALFGIEDIQILAAIVVVACAVAYGALYEIHVKITLVERHLPAGFLRRADFVIRLASTAILAIASYALIDRSTCGFACGHMTANLEIVHSPFYQILAGSMAICAAYLAYSVVRDLRADPDLKGR